MHLISCSFSSSCYLQEPSQAWLWIKRRFIVLNGLMKWSEQKRFSLKAKGGEFKKRTFELMSMLLLWINAAWIWKGRKRERARKREKRVTKKTIFLLITTIELFSQHKHLLMLSQGSSSTKALRKRTHKSCMIYCLSTEKFPIAIAFHACKSI